MDRSRQTVEAIVLTSQEARADRVITLLTDEHGRFPAFAKGAMGSKRRFGAHVEPLTLSQVDISMGGRGMPRLLEASALDGLGHEVTIMTWAQRRPKAVPVLDGPPGARSPRTPPRTAMASPWQA